MGKKSRSKGASGELEVVAIARECGFFEARRTAPMQAGHSRDYPDIDGVGNLWIESKRHKRVSVNAYAKEHILETERPGWVSVLAYRDDRADWLAVVDLRELFKLVRLVRLALPVTRREDDGLTLEVIHEGRNGRTGNGAGAFQLVPELRGQCACTHARPAGRETDNRASEGVAGISPVGSAATKTGGRE